MDSLKTDSFKRGVVKFFDPNKGWGFIIPDERNPADPDECVFFRSRGGFHLQEEFMGEITMDLANSIVGAPESGDEVVYEESSDWHSSTRGPSAWAWSYMGYYRRARRIIEARTVVNDLLCRVVHFPSGKLSQVITVKPWSELKKLGELGDSMPWFMKPRSDIEFQNLRVEGWRHCLNPCHLASGLNIGTQPNEAAA